MSWKPLVITVGVILLIGIFHKPCLALGQACKSNNDCCANRMCINSKCTYSTNFAPPYLNSALTASNNKNLVTDSNNNLTLQNELSLETWNWDGKNLTYRTNDGMALYIPPRDPNNPNQVVTMTTARPLYSAVLLSSNIIASSDYSAYLTLDPKTNLVVWGDGYTIPPITFNIFRF